MRRFLIPPIALPTPASSVPVEILLPVFAPIFALTLMQSREQTRDIRRVNQRGVRLHDPVVAVLRVQSSGFGEQIPKSHNRRPLRMLPSRRIQKSESIRFLVCHCVIARECLRG